ncbi:MAG TPA: cupin domain-containing protein [Planctomycetota bacterium]
MKMATTFLSGSVLALALVPWLVGAQQLENKAAAKIMGKQLVAASELKWVPLPAIPGAEQAALVGDPAKEAHRAFFKYPVGLKSPLHTHSHGDRGVIVSGTLSLAVDGAPAKKLGPGSFFSLAAGVRHVTAVEGDQPCVFYMEREGPFDVVVVEEAGAKK